MPTLSAHVLRAGNTAWRPTFARPIEADVTARKIDWASEVRHRRRETGEATPGKGIVGTSDTPGSLTPMASHDACAAPQVKWRQSVTISRYRILSTSPQPRVSVST